MKVPLQKSRKGWRYPLARERFGSPDRCSQKVSHDKFKSYAIYVYKIQSRTAAKCFVTSRLRKKTANFENFILVSDALHQYSTQLFWHLIFNYTYFQAFNTHNYGTVHKTVDNTSLFSLSEHIDTIENNSWSQIMQISIIFKHLRAWNMEAAYPSQFCSVWDKKKLNNNKTRGFGVIHMQCPCFRW